MLNSRGRPLYLCAAGLAWSLPTLVTIPSAAGFAGKVLLAATLLGGLTWLAVGAVVNMAMSLYYLSLVTEMYLKSAPNPHTLSNRPGYLVASR